MISLDFLQKFSALLRKSLSQKESYSAVFDILDEVVEFDSATLFIFDQESNSLKEVMTRGDKAVDLASEIDFNLGGGLSGWVASQHEPLIFSTLRNDESDRDFCSMASLPLWIGDDFIGVLNLGHTQPGHFNQDSKPIFSHLAVELALILHQLDLTSQLQQKNELLSKLLDELRETQLLLIDKERLAAIGEVTVKINHEINNPLSIIISQADLLNMRAESDFPEISPALTAIKESAYRIRDLIQALDKLETSHAEDYAEGVKMLKLD